MKILTKLFKCFSISLLLLLGLAMTYSPEETSLEETAKLSEEMMNISLASKIISWYDTHGADVYYTDILKTIKTVKKYREEILGDRPFVDKDILAIIWLESGFNPKAQGKVGEVGLMQILDWERHLEEVERVTDPYDIQCNIVMGLKILKEKYDIMGSRRKAIIAYNGLVYMDNKLQDKYWHKFLSYRKILQEYHDEIISG